MNVALKPMTVASYLAWLEQQPRGRFELVDGQVVAMNSQRIEHAEIKLSVAFALKEALSDRPCHVVGDGMAIQIDDDTVYEPDALVYCGERLKRGTIIFSTPVLVVEILSPSTKTIDTTKKLEGYFKLPSVRHYLIIDPDSRTIVHHARDEKGAITTLIANAGDLWLDALSVRLLVAACFPD